MCVWEREKDSELYNPTSVWGSLGCVSCSEFVERPMGSTAKIGEVCVCVCVMSFGSLWCWGGGVGSLLKFSCALDRACLHTYIITAFLELNTYYMVIFYI